MVRKDPLDEILFIQLLKELAEKIKEYEHYLGSHPGYRYLKNMIECTLKSLES